MQRDIYYFQVFSTRILVDRLIVHRVHPLTQFKVTLNRSIFQSYQKDLDKLDCIQNWVYAGRHNGIIQIQNQSIFLQVQAKQKGPVLLTLKLHQRQYNLQKDQVVGKHNLFIKNYIRKFRYQNRHFFEQKAYISTQFALCYQIFVQKTQEGLQRIIIQYQRSKNLNRPRRNTPTQSNFSYAFSDAKNYHQVKGQNRLLINANFVSVKQLENVSKFNIQYLNKSNNVSTPQITSHMKNKNNYFRSQMQKKTQNQNEQQKQQHDISPVLPRLNLKRFISQQVKYQDNFFNSPTIKQLKKLPFMKNPNKKQESNSQRRRKLMEDFQIKKRQFKLRIVESKQDGFQLPRPSTDRIFSRGNSTRLMKTVRLSEWQKLPQQKPWAKKLKLKNQERNKKIMFISLIFMFFLLYVAMQPNKKSVQTQNKHQQKTVYKPYNKDKLKKIRSFSKKK